MESQEKLIKLIQFPRYNSFPNLSPFCTKLETYLRMMKIPYENKFAMDTQKAPKQRFPFIEYKDRKIADSTLIIDFLKNDFGDSLDQALSAEEKAIAVAFQRLLEDNLLLALVYFRWVDAECWQKFREIIFGKLPQPIKFFISRMIRKKVMNRLLDQGISQHTREEIISIAQKDIKSTADFLGNKRYFFGNQPTTIDAALFGVIGNCVYDPIHTPLHEIVNQYPNLISHSQRMLSEYFSELKVNITN